MAHSIRGFLRRCGHSFFLVGLLSMLWLLLRTGTKPSRSAYPCQKAAAANSYLWLSIYFLPFLSSNQKRISARFDIRKVAIIAAVTVFGGAVALWSMTSMSGQVETSVLRMTGRTGALAPLSEIFVVDNTMGNDGGLEQLIELMGQHGSRFYQSQTEGKDRGPNGIVAKNDVVIIKVNSQWDERGGTNTDLLRALIKAIVSHPDGFDGEIVVADNGQDQYGSLGRGGSLSWTANNAEDTSQSVQRVVDSFSTSHKVSTYLWDTITTRRVNEYSEGDMEDGYIVNATANPRTGIMVSYPKFKTKHGTHISFKLGVWSPQTRNYNGSKLKVISLPVLKTHGGFGVTASVKHYMGLVSDKLTAQLGTRSHNTVRSGGMGSEMVETRFPDLNIIDAIWVNPVPKAGPRNTYGSATRANVIASSTDPVALDYWTSKYILLQIAKAKGSGDTSSIDPDNTASGSFGDWLRLSMQEMLRAGKQATVDESHMNVYVSHRVQT